MELNYKQITYKKRGTEEEHTYNKLYVVIGGMEIEVVPVAKTEDQKRFFKGMIRHAIQNEGK